MWVRFDDGFDDDPDLAHMTPEAVALYLCMNTWSARHLSDGLVPFGAVKRLFGYCEEAIAALCASHDGRDPWVVRVDDGFAIRSFLRFNPSREQVAAKRASAAERMRSHRCSRERTPEQTRERTRERTPERTPERTIHDVAETDLAGSGTSAPDVSHDLQACCDSGSSETCSREQTCERTPTCSPVRSPVRSPSIPVPLSSLSRERDVTNTNGPDHAWVEAPTQAGLVARTVRSCRLLDGKPAYGAEALSEARSTRLGLRLSELDPGGDEVQNLLDQFVEYHSRKRKAPYTDPLRALGDWITRAEATWRRLKRERERDARRDPAGLDRRASILANVTGGDK